MVVRCRNPVFLVGCPRSGTTLLQRMLDAHDSMAIASETHFVRRFWLKRENYGDLATDENYKRLLEDVVGMPEFAEMGVDDESFRNRARAAERTYAAVFAALLETFAEQHGVPFIGEKTPNHLLHMLTLERFFPDAKYIHIVRDPRAVVNSWRNVPWSTGNVVGDAFVWRRYMLVARLCPPRRSNSLMVIRFEDLVLRPEPTLTDVCRFIGISFQPGMCAFHDKREIAINLSREPWKARANQPLDANRLGRWRDELSRLDIALIESVAGREMHKYEYTSICGRFSAVMLKLPVWSREIIRRLFRRVFRWNT